MAYFRRHWLFLFFAWLCAAAGPACASIASIPEAVPAAKPLDFNRTLSVGVQTSLDPEFFTEAFGPLMLRLRTLFPGLTFESRLLSAPELSEAVKRRTVDLFFADSGVFAYAMREQGAIELAARVRPGVSDPREATAMALVVRRESAFEKLEDVAGKRLVADDAESAGTWLSLLALLAGRGVDPERAGRNARFTHYAAPGPLALLVRGEADAAALPACELERSERSGVVPPGALRVLEPQPGGRCQRTGPYFPDVILGAAPGADPALLRLIAIATLSLDPGMEAGNSEDPGDRWSLVNDFSNVDSVYRTLKTGPYAYLGKTDWRTLLSKYKEAVTFAVLLLAAGLFHLLRVQQLVARRTRELEEAQRALQRGRERLYLMERTGVVSGLCSMLVHEARQPLATLVAYAGGLAMLLKGRPADPAISEASGGILREARRLDAIVSHVSSYARQSDHPRVEQQASELARRAAKSFKLSSASDGVALQVEAGAGEMPVLGEPLELELALVNLLKNAAQAGRENHKDDKNEKGGSPVPVSLAVVREAGAACFVVSDAGRALAPEELSALSGMVRSSRPGGLGLGLFLVRRIAEGHGGSLRFRARPGGGLSAELRIPLSGGDGRPGEGVKGARKEEDEQ